MLLCGADCSNRDRYTSGGVGRREHVAAAVENSAGIDDHARGMHFAGNYTLRFDLDTALGKDYAIKSTGDDHAISFNLPFDAGAFT